MQRSAQHPAYCFRDQQVKFMFVAFFKQITVFKILDPLHFEIVLLLQVVDNLELGLNPLRGLPVEYCARTLFLSLFSEFSEPHYFITL